MLQGKTIWIGIIAAFAIMVLLVSIVGGIVSTPKTVERRVAPAPPLAPPAIGEVPTTSLDVSPAPTAAMTVSVTDDGFVPQLLSVRAGDTVTFRNDGTASVQVSSAPHPTHTNYPPLNGGILVPTGSQTVVFSEAGTFGYHDHLLPANRGTVVVEAR